MHNVVDLIGLDQTRLVKMLEKMTAVTDKNKEELQAYTRQIELELQRTDKNL